MRWSVFLSVMAVFVIPCVSLNSLALAGAADGSTVYVSNAEVGAVVIDPTHQWVDEVTLRSNEHPKLQPIGRLQLTPPDIVDCSAGELRYVNWRDGKWIFAVGPDTTKRYTIGGVNFEVTRVEAGQTPQGGRLRWISFNRNGIHDWSGHFVFDERRGVISLTFRNPEDKTIIEALFLVRGVGLLSVPINR